MATILDKLTPSAELGERVGRGVSSGLQSLVDNKLKQLQKQAGLMGTMDPQRAQMLSMMPDNLFSILLPQIMKKQQYEQGLAALGGDQNQQPDNQFNNLINPEQMVQPGVGLGSNGPQTNQDILQQVLGSQQGGQVQPGQSMYEQQMQQQKSVGNNISSKEKKAYEKHQKVAADNARINEVARQAHISNNGNPMAVQQAVQNERNRILKEDQFQINEERKLRKEKLDIHNAPANQKFIEKQSELYKDAVDNEFRLSRMTELISRKNLTRPLFYNLLNTLKGGLGVLGASVDLKHTLSPDSQEFDKLSKDMLKGAKNIFGSRLTDADVKIFLDMVPTLGMTRDGKKAVIRNISIFNKGIKLREDAMEKLIEKNDGFAPMNLKIHVERMIKPELDKLAKDFREGSIPKTKKEQTGLFNAKSMGGVNSLKGVANTLFGKA